MKILSLLVSSLFSVSAMGAAYVECEYHQNELNQDGFYRNVKTIEGLKSETLKDRIVDGINIGPSGNFLIPVKGTPISIQGYLTEGVFMEIGLNEDNLGVSTSTSDYDDFAIITLYTNRRQIAHDVECRVILL